MAKEALTLLLGRAALDEKFLEELAKDPKKAAQSARVDLSHEEITALKAIDYNGLKELQRSIKSKQIAAIFDKKDA